MESPPQPQSHPPQKELSQKSAIKVYIRVRPILYFQLGSKQIVTVQQNNQTVNIMQDSLSILQTKFDFAFSQQKTQKYIFDQFTTYLHRIPEGYNMTIFAYGQTGSGKTYTMFGSDWQLNISKNLQTFHHKKKQNTFFQDLTTDQNFAGIIPRSIYKLFQDIKIYQNNQIKFKIYCSFLQIYDQKIYDLLQDFHKPHPLNLHESKFDGIFVQGLTQYAVTHYLDCLQLMKRGQKNRFIRQTSMNNKSSRSHTIFQILLQSLHPDPRGMFKKARLNLCDLAGSQKINKFQMIAHDHFRQLKNINQSLSTLGKVIYCLSSNPKNIPPFRQSKLTRLLQDSLTANTFTFIVGNISPSLNSIDQTINTMKFVQRAKHVMICEIFLDCYESQKNGIQWTECISCQQITKIISQIKYLKQLLNIKRKGITTTDIHDKLLILQQQNQKLKKTSVSIEDVQRLILQNRQMKIQIHKLLMFQYSQNDGDNKSDSVSLESSTHHPHTNKYNNNSFEEGSMKYSNNESNYELPIHSEHHSPRNNHNVLTHSKYAPNHTNNSLMRIGKNILQLQQFSKYNTNELNPPSTTKNKQKQKILYKLEQLQKIQKFNQQKLIKDLQQLQKKNKEIKSTFLPSPIKKNHHTKPIILFNQKQKKYTINYQNKIKQLQNKLFPK